MLVYSTHLYVSDELDKDLLIDMFLDWIMNSKNNIQDLEYDGSYSYECEDNSKKLMINDFDNEGILGLQFINNDTSRKMTFIVEVLFDYMNYTIDLNFYNEIDHQSIYREIKGIPNIFKTILGSKYIKDDYGIKIKNTPHYMGRIQYDHILKNIHSLPIVIMNKNKELNHYCVVHPNKLAEKLYGLAHVIIINDIKDPELKIIYPNTYKEIIHNQSESGMMSICYSHIMDYLLKVNEEYYKYEDLLTINLHRKHESQDQDNNEINDMFYEEIELYEEMLIDVKKEYQELNQRLMELNDLEEKLKSKHKAMKKEAILYTSSNQEEVEEVLLALVKKIHNNYKKKAQSRRLHVLDSIIRGYKE